MGRNSKGTQASGLEADLGRGGARIVLSLKRWGHQTRGDLRVFESDDAVSERSIDASLARLVARGLVEEITDRTTGPVRTWDRVFQLTAAGTALVDRQQLQTRTRRAVR